MKQKITIKVQMKCDKCRNKALKIAANVKGVSSVSIEGEDKDRVVVKGEDVDTVCLGKLLKKKFGCVTVLTVEEVKSKPCEKKLGCLCSVSCDPCLKCHSCKCHGDSKPCPRCDTDSPKCHGDCNPCSKCESHKCHGDCKPCSKCDSYGCHGQCTPYICVPPPSCNGHCPPWTSCPSCSFKRPCVDPCYRVIYDSSYPDSCSIQ